MGNRVGAWRLGALALVGGLVLAAGCAHELVYLPVGPGTSGAAAARYPIPPERPQGEAYVTSFGFTDMDTGGQQGPLLHARLAVSNGSAATWSVDARLQRLLAPGQPARLPSFVNTDAGGGGPTYLVPPGRANVFDLYFSVPPLAQASDLGGFSLDWNVDAGGQMVAQATSFHRFESAPSDYDYYGDYPPYVTVGLGFGLDWWGGPLFVGGGFAPHIHRYYYPPRGIHGGPWYGPRPGGWRAVPPGGGWAHAGAVHGGFHGGGFHGGGFHGGGFHGGGHGGGGHR